MNRRGNLSLLHAFPFPVDPEAFGPAAILKESLQIEVLLANILIGSKMMNANYLPVAGAGTDRRWLNCDAVLFCGIVNRRQPSFGVIQIELYVIIVPHL
jgi:hypothetical protein